MDVVRELVEASGVERAATAAPASRLVTESRQDAQAKIDAGYRLTGEAMADTLMTLGQTFGGEDWKPKELWQDGKCVFNEGQNLRDAWGKLAVRYKWAEFPPAIAVLIATGAYVAPRLTAPSTKARFGKLRLWWENRKIDKEAAKLARDRAIAERFTGKQNA